MFRSVLRLTLVMTMLSPNLWAQGTTEKIEEKIKQEYYKIVDKTDHAVEFSKGSSIVSESESSSLKALFNSMRGSLAGGEIVIAGWSDHDFPPNTNDKLSAEDAQLAMARIERVKKIIKALGLKNTIQTINLGEQNQPIAKLFGSSEEQVKDAMQSGDTDSRKIAAIVKVLKSDGGPRKVVVLVRRLSD